MFYDMERKPTTSFQLRGLDPAFWERVKRQASKDDITLEDLGYKLFAEYLAKREGKTK